MKDSSEYNKEFGERVHKFRIKRGFSLGELAIRAGYKSENSRSTIKKIEDGVNAVPLPKVKALAKALDVPPMVLLGLEPDDNLDDDEIDRIGYRLDALPPIRRDNAIIDIKKILDYYETMGK